MVQLAFDHNFESLSSFHVEQSNITCYTVENPVDCWDFSHMQDKQVLIDGVPYKIRAVEFSAHMPPYLAGENISLATERVGIQ